MVAAQHLKHSNDRSESVMVLTEVLIHKLIVNLMGSKWVECKVFLVRSVCVCVEKTNSIKG